MVFVPVFKSDVNRDDILNTLLEHNTITKECKVSFVTDDEVMFQRLKEWIFPILSLCISIIKIRGG